MTLYKNLRLSLMTLTAFALTSASSYAETVVQGPLEEDHRCEREVEEGKTASETKRKQIREVREIRESRIAQ